MVLPIMQFDRYTRKGFAGQVSDASLSDTITGVGPAVRHGVLVAITGVADSTAGAPADAFEYAELAGGAQPARKAIVTRSHFDQIEGGIANGVKAGEPANLLETGRAWVLLKTGVTPVAQGPVEIAAPSTGSDVLAGLKGTVTNPGGTAKPVAGVVFTGRVDKDANGVNIAEVQIRPQTV